MRGVITQREIARRCGVTQPVVSQVLARRRSAASPQITERVWREVYAALVANERARA